MTHKTSIVLLLSLTLAPGACTVDGSWTEETPSAQATTLELLQKGADFSFLPQQSSVAIEVKWDRGNESSEASTNLTLLGGQILLSADEQGIVQIDGIDIELDDLTISHQALPSDIHLTEIAVHMSEAQDCEFSDWSEDDETGNASLHADMVLEWSLVTPENEVVPLGAQELAAIPLQLDLERGQQGLLVRLRVDGDGPFWSWLDSVELRDLQLDLRADEFGPID